MGVLKALVEGQLELGLEGAQRGEGARGKDDRARLQALDLTETYTRVEAPKAKDSSYRLRITFFVPLILSSKVELVLS